MNGETNPLSQCLTGRLIYTIHRVFWLQFLLMNKANIARQKTPKRFLDFLILYLELTFWASYKEDVACPMFMLVISRFVRWSDGFSLPKLCLDLSSIKSLSNVNAKVCSEAFASCSWFMIYPLRHMIPLEMAPRKNSINSRVGLDFSLKGER